jgi:prophage antirepressor-like protein
MDIKIKMNKKDNRINTFNILEDTQDFSILVIDGEKWFVAEEIAEKLEYPNTEEMLLLIDPEDGRIVNPQDFNRHDESTRYSDRDELIIINEIAFYTAMMSSSWSVAKYLKRAVIVNTLIGKTPYTLGCLTDV